MVELIDKRIERLKKHRDTLSKGSRNRYNFIIGELMALREEVLHGEAKV